MAMAGPAGGDAAVPVPVGFTCSHPRAPPRPSPSFSLSLSLSATAAHRGTRDRFVFVLFFFLSFFILLYINKKYTPKIEEIFSREHNTLSSSSLKQREKNHLLTKH
jgi:hypothetical protein